MASSVPRHRRSEGENRKFKEDADCMQVLVDTSTASLPLEWHLTVHKSKQTVPFDHTLYRRST